MAETSGKADPQEPSMEDILASIRRILAEDAVPVEGDPADAEPRSKPAAAPPPGPLEDVAEPEEKAMTPERAPASAASLAEELFDASPAPSPRPIGPSNEMPDEEDEFVLSPDMRVDRRKLVSEQVAVDSTDVLSQLARAILDRRDIHVTSRDVTLESMVREMLRPLLREWLDRNLPYLIERLVKKEIDLMINRAERLED
jgi:cell pole-organizing protein PopZ